MTRRFLPPPDAERCQAVVIRPTYDIAQRCLYRRANYQTDLCARHLVMERDGQDVRRARRPGERLDG